MISSAALQIHSAMVSILVQAIVIIGVIMRILLSATEMVTGVHRHQAMNTIAMAMVHITDANQTVQATLRLIHVNQIAGLQVPVTTRLQAPHSIRAMLMGQPINAINAQPRAS